MTRPGSPFVDIQLRLESLRGMNKAALRAQWLELFDRPVGQLRKDLLIRILSYRIQEQAYGGLSSITHGRLRQLARAFEENPKGAIPSLPTIKPGTRLLRQWRRQTHTVTALEDGFEYKGNPLRQSLPDCPADYRHPLVRTTLFRAQTKSQGKQDS